MKSLEPQNQYKNQESYNSNVDPFDEQIDDIDDKEPEKSRKRERK